MHAHLMKALSHPRRLEIVQLLRDQELCVSDIYEMLDLPQPNISQHLMVLRDAQVVKTKKRGKQVWYQIAHPKIIEASDCLRQVLTTQNTDKAIAKLFNFSMKDMVPVVHDHPVCHMRISPKTAGSVLDYQGKRYYFCATGCSKKFMEHPSNYV